MNGKKISESRTFMTEVVLPNDTNPLGILLGGRLVFWMDIAAAVCAQTHAGRIAVTASIDNIGFDLPIREGEVVFLEASVVATFRTSMEIMVDVWKKGITETEKLHSNNATFTFVAVDESGKAVEVPPITELTEEEQIRFDAAVKRRAQRLGT